MKDLEQYLRENAPEIPEEGQFLIETNARLNAVEGIKKTMDRERRHWRMALMVALSAGLALGCAVTLLVRLCPVPPVRVDGSVLTKAMEAVYGWKDVLFGLIACCGLALGVLFVTREREAL